MKKIIRLSLFLTLLSILLSGCNHSSDVAIAERGKPSFLTSLGVEINDEQYAGVYLEDGIYHVNVVGDTNRIEKVIDSPAVEVKEYGEGSIQY